MNPNMDILVVLAVIAVYQQRGVVEAMALLLSHGFKSTEAMALLGAYDGYVVDVKAGKFRV